MRRLTLTVATLVVAAPAMAQSFVNWESPHVNPVDLTPDGSRLLVVNTADNRLEVFDVTEDGLTAAGSIPVGLDPVSVRARSNSEAWVANHVSDSISIVDLGTMNVRATLAPGDEPADVLFAGTPARAFVSVSQLNQVKVYDPADLAAPPIVLEIEGEDPRALSTDGDNVYVAIFESGNGTTSLNEQLRVSVPALNPYPGDPNPPPNDGEGFFPPINPDLPAPPRVDLIVQKQPNGSWLDDNGGDWSAAVTWDLHDHDVAVIDVETLDVRYVTGAMNLTVHLDAGPNGVIAAIGTDAINQVRYEPNLNGVFVRSIIVGFNAGSSSPTAILDLNPHLAYDTPTVPQNVRDLAVGDPRAVKWSGSGDRVYVAGMGSNNLLILDSSGARLGLVEVGEGPTGIAVDDPRGRLYVVNKFDGSVSIVDPAAQSETGRVPFFDPTPAVIRAGRPHLYDTHATSGLGQASCASCHVDGRMDATSWDLGDPSGEMKVFNQDCMSDDCIDWHPMKGPMSTQTLFGIVGTEPLHWRGDREDLAAFNPAFEGLLGDDEQLSPQSMDEFEAFVATLTFPPNPNRNIDNSLATLLENGGNPQVGEILFGAAGAGPGGALPPEAMAIHTGGLMTLNGQGNFNCNGCHAVPTGTDARILQPIIAGGLTQNSKTAQLRNVYEKTGFDAEDPNASPLTRGYGLLHGGSFPSLEFFLNFFFDVDEQQTLDIEAFLLSFATDTHAGAGVQVTLADEGDPDPEQTALILEMMDLAGAGDLGLVVKGRRGGLPRGYVFAGGAFQSDRAAEAVAPIDLVNEVGPGAELTFTLVPFGTETRVGVDRDEDGHLDRDEIDQGSDPADPNDVPTCLADIDRDEDVGFPDLLAVLSAWGPCEDPGDCREDLDQNGDVEFNDLLIVLSAWGACR